MGMQGVDKWDDAVSIRIYTVGAFWLVGCFWGFFFLLSVLMTWQKKCEER